MTTNLKTIHEETREPVLYQGPEFWEAREERCIAKGDIPGALEATKNAQMLWHNKALKDPANKTFVEKADSAFRRAIQLAGRMSSQTPW